MRSLILAAALFGAAGCGGGNPTATLHGKITVGGEAPPRTVVVFLAGDNSTHMTDVLADGTYTISGVPVGPVTVSIQQSPPLPASRPQTPAAGGFVGESKDAKRATEPPAAKVKGPIVPAKYADPKLSGLSFEVKQSDQEWSADLK